MSRKMPPRSKIRNFARLFGCSIHRAPVSCDGWDVRVIFALSFVFTLTILLAAVPRSRVHASEAPVTYSRQIAPILYKNCTGCHHTGGSGPFSLMTYPEAKRWSGVMESVTQSRYMPPWLPEPGHGDFAGNRRLSQADIDLIKRWTETRMPEGDLAEAPKAPVYASDWQLGPPDLILEVDSPMQVPASGTDLFRNFVLPFPLKQSKYIRAMEIKPGSPQVVHHANLIIDRSGSLRRTHPKDWQVGIPGMDVVVDAGEKFDPDGHFLDWKPDSTALVEPSGMAWRLDPGNDLVLNTHLKPTGKVETIRAKIGLYFTPDAPTKLPILVQLEHDAALKIPAGDKDFVVEDKLKLPEAVDVLAIYPHAHYLGKRLEGWADLPGGARVPLILIPSWDIDRQSIYRYAQPVPLPAGSVIHMRYSYDNSAANPHNPNSPPIRVTAGNRSVDEMGHLWLQLLPHPTPGEQSDPREPILRAWMENVLRKNPADPTALFNLASVDMAQGDYGTAATLYQRAVDARPGDARMMTALASALLESGDWQHAREELLAAAAADPGYADALYNLALIETSQEMLPEAQKHLQATVALEPANIDAHHGLVAIYTAQHDLAAAIREQKAVVAIDASRPDDWNDLGALLARHGDRAAAHEAFEHALGLDPANTIAQANLKRLDAAER
jgi:Flp pilus assembly protein TadD/mono/diheme cytochrome c family protein